MEWQKLTEEEFKKFSDLIQEISGIFMKDTKITLLSNRLRKRLREKKFNTFEEYYNYIKKNNDLNELDEMLNVVSTNETYFFRNIKHFEALVEEIIPKMISSYRYPIKIWSAGCSTGEEPYTIAMLLKEKGLLDKRYVEILGSDINTQVLEYAKNGIYDIKKLRTTPEKYILKYFDKNVENNYVLKKEIVNFVKFTRINLKKDNFSNDYDIIFCRNVMIYFDKDDQKLLVDKFYKSLKKGGYLFIGHSESLYFINNDFRYLKINESPVYYKE